MSLGDEMYSDEEPASSSSGEETLDIETAQPNTAGTDTTPADTNTTQPKEQESLREDNSLRAQQQFPFALSYREHLPHQFVLLLEQFRNGLNVVQQLHDHCMGVAEAFGAFSAQLRKCQQRNGDAYDRLMLTDKVRDAVALTSRVYTLFDLLPDSTQHFSTVLINNICSPLARFRRVLMDQRARLEARYFSVSDALHSEIRKLKQQRQECLKQWDALVSAFDKFHWADPPQNSGNKKKNAQLYGLRAHIQRKLEANDSVDAKDSVDAFFSSPMILHKSIPKLLDKCLHSFHCFQRLQRLCTRNYHKYKTEVLPALLDQLQSLELSRIRLLKRSVYKLTKFARESHLGTRQDGLSEDTSTCLGDSMWRGIVEGLLAQCKALLPEYCLQKTIAYLVTQYSIPPLPTRVSLQSSNLPCDPHAFVVPHVTDKPSDSADGGRAFGVAPVGSWVRRVLLEVAEQHDLIEGSLLDAVIASELQPDKPAEIKESDTEIKEEDALPSEYPLAKSIDVVDGNSNEVGDSSESGVIERDYFSVKSTSNREEKNSSKPEKAIYGWEVLKEGFVRKKVRIGSGAQKRYMVLMGRMPETASAASGPGSGPTVVDSDPTSSETTLLQRLHSHSMATNSQLIATTGPQNTPKPPSTAPPRAPNGALFYFKSLQHASEFTLYVNDRRAILQERVKNGGAVKGKGPDSGGGQGNSENGDISGFSRDFRVCGVIPVCVFSVLQHLNKNGSVAESNLRTPQPHRHSARRMSSTIISAQLSGDIRVRSNISEKDCQLYINVRTGLPTDFALVPESREFMCNDVISHFPANTKKKVKFTPDRMFLFQCSSSIFAASWSRLLRQVAFGVTARKATTSRNNAQGPSGMAIQTKLNAGLSDLETAMLSPTLKSSAPSTSRMKSLRLSKLDTTSSSKKASSDSERQSSEKKRTFALANFVRGLVSKQKRRYQKDGYDLDLTYILPSVIAMGIPSEGMTGVYRNPLSEVQRFFQEYHREGFTLFNLCSERKYDHQLFKGNVHHFGFDDHNPSPLGMVLPILRAVYRSLYVHTGGKASVDHDIQGLFVKSVAAIHCKAGKGRTGFIVCCLLLYLGICETAEEALNYFGRMRTYDGQGVTIPSQRRYIHYFARMLSTLREHQRKLFPSVYRSLDGGDKEQTEIKSTEVPESVFDMVNIGSGLPHAEPSLVLRSVTLHRIPSSLEQQNPSETDGGEAKSLLGDAVWLMVEFPGFSLKRSTQAGRASVQPRSSTVDYAKLGIDAEQLLLSDKFVKGYESGDTDAQKMLARNGCGVKTCSVCQFVRHSAEGWKSLSKEDMSKVRKPSPMALFAHIDAFFTDIWRYDWGMVSGGSKDEASQDKKSDTESKLSDTLSKVVSAKGSVNTRKTVVTQMNKADDNIWMGGKDSQGLLSGHGDWKIAFYSQSDQLFSCWLHTAMLEEILIQNDSDSRESKDNTSSEPNDDSISVTKVGNGDTFTGLYRVLLTKKELDKACKDRKHRKFDAGFCVELVFSNPEIDCFRALMSK